MYKRKRPCKPGYTQYSDGFIDPTTNKRRIVTVSFKSVSKRVDERVARKLLDEKMKEVMAKEGTVYGKLHLHELILMRVEWLNKFYKPRTAISAKWHLASIEKRLGDPIVENLTLQYMESHLSDGGDIAPVTYNEMLKHLKSLLRWAMGIPLEAVSKKLGHEHSKEST